MGTVRVPSDEEIGAAYDQGREAVMALIHNTLEQLANRIQALEDQIAKNSRNSGKPPSSDGYNRPAPKSCFLQVKKCPLYYRKSAHFEKTDIKIIIKKGTTLLSKSSPFLSSTQSR
jgi:transposase